MSILIVLHILLIFRYIIEYAPDATGTIPIPRSLHASTPYERIKLSATRLFNKNDPKYAQFKMAEGHFYAQDAARRAAGKSTGRQIDFIEYVVNDTLEAKFKAKAAEFKARRISDKCILAFHATDAKNIDSILKTNLNYDRTTHGRVYGDGVYFSEFPDFSLRYGNGLILFEVMPGRECIYNGTKGVPIGYNSLKVAADKDGCGEQLVITDCAQFYPRYVFHFK